MENFILVKFLPIFTFSKLSIDQGHFGHFDLNKHFECSNAQIG